MKRTLVGLAILLAGALGGYIFQRDPGYADQANMSASISIFSDLTAEDEERLAAQRRVVFQQAQARYGTSKLAANVADLEVLQNLIDDRTFLPSQTYELQSLGIVFGDIFASRPEFEWKIVSDEYGRDPTLRYKKTSAHLNALTMISKRIESGESVNVTNLFAETLRLFEENRFEFGE